MMGTLQGKLQRAREGFKKRAALFWGALTDEDFERLPAQIERVVEQAGRGSPVERERVIDKLRVAVAELEKIDQPDAAQADPWYMGARSAVRWSRSRSGHA